MQLFLLNKGSRYLKIILMKHYIFGCLTGKLIINSFSKLHGQISGNSFLYYNCNSSTYVLESFIFLKINYGRTH